MDISDTNFSTFVFSGLRTRIIILTLLYILKKENLNPRNRRLLYLYFIIWPRAAMGFTFFKIIFSKKLDVGRTF